MTITSHKLATIANNHGIVGLGPYTTAALRQGATVTSNDVGKVATQVVGGVSTLWYLVSQASGVPTWLQITTAADAASFSGDFGALAATYGLTVRGYWRGDLGLTGTTGTGKTTWTNQMGSASNFSPGPSSTNGVGSAGTGLNGLASMLMDGTTQGGSFTMPTQVAPGTVNYHKYWIGRQPTFSSSNFVLFSGAGFGPTVAAAATNTTTPAADLYMYNYGAGAVTSGVVSNQWYRGRVSYTGTASDVIRVGAHSASGATTNTAPPATGRDVGHGGGSNRANYELLMLMEIEGTLANFLTFATDADTKSRAFWTTAIEI